jgi:Zn-dependent alcohol dehydrogenase
VLRGERLPPGLGAVEADAVWMAYPTAYGALIEIGQLAGGETVIITAASSDVGLAAIHIANTAGAVPIATTRTAGTSGGTRSAQPETSGVDTASGKIRETPELRAVPCVYTGSSRAGRFWIAEE